MAGVQYGQRVAKVNAVTLTGLARVGDCENAVTCDCVCVWRVIGTVRRQTMHKIRRVILGFIRHQINPFSATGRYIGFCSRGEKCR
jgi:hypothetical protein